MTTLTCLGHSRGFTLVELVISMVVVSIALGGVLMVMNYTVMHSADPMLQHQAVAIAEAYLEEALLRSFNDPDGVDGEVPRNLFDDVDDYNGLHNDGAQDQDGNPIAGLGAYTIDVAVAAALLNGVAAQRITVTVRHPRGINLTLSGHRTNYQ